MILEASAKVFLLGICAFSLTNCFNGHVRKAQDANASVSYIPEAPDYDDSIMWITADGDQHGTGADVFYVVSTWEEDWMTADSIVCHYADVWNPKHRERMAIEMNKAAFDRGYEA